ncbi:MAG TPA: ester cyclase [Pedococcus sp.]|nr:ester cyclase [Pedococcus sp.]
MADNADLARSLYDAWNRRDFDAQAEATAADGKIHVVGSGDTYDGPDGSRRYNTMWADAFPDGAITVDRVIPAGDTVVVEFTGRGTHTGDLVTPMGTIPATGRSVTLQLCDVLEFHENKVRSQRSYFDTGSLMTQLGLTEQAATAQRSAGKQ